MAVVLLSGCLTSEVVVEKYVCPDAWLVDDFADCAGHGLECPKANCPTFLQQTTTTCTICDKSVQDNIILYNISASVDECALLGCPPGSILVASAGSDIYHVCGCRYAKSISHQNIVCYSSAADALLDHKRPHDCV